MITTIISFAIIIIVMAAGFQVELEDIDFLPRSQNNARTVYPVGTVILIIMSVFGNDLVLGGAVNALVLLSLIKGYLMARGHWKYVYKKYDAAISLILLCLITFCAISQLCTTF
jgi:hypothetical protein